MEHLTTDRLNGIMGGRKRLQKPQRDTHRAKECGTRHGRLLALLRRYRLSPSEGMVLKAAGENDYSNSRCLHEMRALVCCNARRDSSFLGQFSPGANFAGHRHRPPPRSTSAIRDQLE